MKIFFTCFLALICFSSASYAEKLKFIQVTDAHLSQNGSNYQGRDLENSEKNLKSIVKIINNTQDIDFVVFSGDNIDTPDEKDLIKFCEITKSLNKPYYFAIGDHDISASQGMRKSKYFEIAKKYNKNLKSAEPYYYFFPNNAFIVIVLDGVTNSVIPTAHGLYDDDEIEWLDKLLSKNNTKKAIILQHFPLVEPSVNKSHRTVDPETYFNILSNRKNVISILSGHYHGGEKVTLQDGIYHISTPAFVNSPYKYRVVEINYDRNSLKENSKFDLQTKLIDLMTGN